MIIKIKGKKDLIFNDYNSFYEYVKINIINNLKFDYLSKLEIFYNNNSNFDGIKNFKYIVRKLYYNTTHLNKEYWISRGWNNDEALSKIKEIQRKNSNISQEKSKKLKEKDYLKWCESRTTKKEYYLKKGLSEEESLEALSKRQCTFSLEKCINKYGDEGLNIWKNRQEKWYNKIKNYNFDKNSSSSTYFKNKYGNDWIIYAINKLSFINKEFIKNIIKTSSNDFKKFLKEYSKYKTIISLQDLYFLYNSNILLEFFNLTKNEMIDIIKKELNIKILSFGNIRYFNGHICRSNGEYYIAKKLKENDITYIYEKKYTNSNYICDFYIPKYDLYVEYLGMIKSDYTKKNHPEIYFKYVEKYNQKEIFCKENHINYMYEKDFKIITQKIINYGN